MCPHHPVHPDLHPFPPPFSVQYSLPPHWYWARDYGNNFHRRLPLPLSSVYTAKLGSDGVSGRDEGFISCNSYKYGAGYGIQTVRLLPDIFMGLGFV